MGDSILGVPVGIRTGRLDLEKEGLAYCMHLPSTVYCLRTHQLLYDLS